MRSDDTMHHLKNDPEATSSCSADLKYDRLSFLGSVPMEYSYGDRLDGNDDLIV